jgi:hypothetical protein
LKKMSKNDKNDKIKIKEILRGNEMIKGSKT